MNMDSYTKLFSSIVTSTIWNEDDKTRIVWITMLALADKNGEVQGSIPGLARIAGVPIEACEAALKKFLSPDPYSRTKDEQGRRIEEIDGGWSLLNHGKYRLLASKEDAIAKNAERQRRFREKENRNGRVTDSNGEVTPALPIAESKPKPKSESEPNAYTDTDTDTDKIQPKAQQAALESFSLGSAKEEPVKKPKRFRNEPFKQPSFEETQEFGKEIGMTDAESAYVFEWYESKGWTIGKAPMRSWKAAWRTAKLSWDFGKVNAAALEASQTPTKEQMAEWTQNRIDREREREERAAAKARGETWEEKNDF